MWKTSLGCDRRGGEGAIWTTKIPPEGGASIWMTPQKVKSGKGAGRVSTAVSPTVGKLVVVAGFRGRDGVAAFGKKFSDTLTGGTWRPYTLDLRDHEAYLPTQ
jgi:hypothetical protein